VHNFSFPQANCGCLYKKCSEKNLLFQSKIPVLINKNFQITGFSPESEILNLL